MNILEISRKLKPPQRVIFRKNPPEYIG